MTELWILLTLLEIKVISLFIVTIKYCTSEIITFKKRKSFKDLVTEVIDKNLQKRFVTEVIRKKLKANE